MGEASGLELGNLYPREKVNAHRKCDVLSGITKDLTPWAEAHSFIQDCQPLNVLKSIFAFSIVVLNPFDLISFLY